MQSARGGPPAGGKTAPKIRLLGIQGCVSSVLIWKSDCKLTPSSVSYVEGGAVAGARPRGTVNLAFRGLTGWPYRTPDQPWALQTPPREVEAVPRPLESSSTSGEVTLARKVLEGLSRLYLDSGRAVSNSPVSAGSSPARRRKKSFHLMDWADVTRLGCRGRAPRVRVPPRSVCAASVQLPNSFVSLFVSELGVRVSWTSGCDPDCDAVGHHNDLPIGQIKRSRAMYMDSLYTLLSSFVLKMDFNLKKKKKTSVNILLTFENSSLKKDLHVSVEPEIVSWAASEV